jgi:predicted CXXCH cytochrome family protein
MPQLRRHGRRRSQVEGVLIQPARSRSAKILLLVTFALCLTGAQLRSSDPTSRNDGYAEPGTCAACHQQIAESYARTAMARTFGVVRNGDEFPELNWGGSFHHAASDEQFTVFQRDDKPHLKRHQIAFDGSVTNIVEAKIDYWFGSGNHARSYISRTNEGELIELPLTWYADKGGYWAMSPGYDRPDHGGFSRKLSHRCMACHNGNIQVLAEDSAEGGLAGHRFPTRLPEGIDCQRCHGPGQAHIAAVSQGLPAERVRNAIVNPARLKPERQLEVCMQCHLETTSLRLPAALLRYGRGVFSYRPGEPLADYALHFDRTPTSHERKEGPEEAPEFVSAAYRLRQSACYLKSNGTLTCTTCHNPHEPSAAPAALRRNNDVCLRCHKSAVEQLTVSRRHPESQDCAGCHMPKRRPTDAIHTRITDHLIQRHMKTEHSDPPFEKHDGNTPPYRGRVQLYYPSKLDVTSERELYLALAQVKHDANLADGLHELAAAIDRHKPEHPEFYFELAEAYRRVGKLGQAIPFYEQSAARAPADWRYSYRLGTALVAAGQSARGGVALERARALAPREPAVVEAIANLLASQGKLLDAAAMLKAALAADPDAANLHNALGARQLQLNDAKGAEAAWREAVRLRPEAASMRLNLANLLAHNARFQEAQYHFKAAIRSAPDFADTHLAYAIALQAQGEVAQAEHHLREAIRLSPEFFESHLRLGQMLHTNGDVARAAPFLRKAAQSPEARVREAASALLRAK